MSNGIHPRRGVLARRRVWLLLGVAILALVGVLIALCRPTVHLGYIDKDKAAVVTKIDRFHAEWNAGSLEKIYAEADETLRQYPGGRDSLLKAMQETRDGYGKFNRTTFSYLNLLMNPVQVRAIYNSEFEKGGATEWFTFLLRGNDFKLAHYEVHRGKSLDYQAALQGTEVFYRQLTAEQYDSLYESLSNEFKAVGDRDAVLGFFKKLNQALGACKEPSLAPSDNTSPAPIEGKKLVRLIFSRNCKKAEATETFDWKIESQNAKLVSYEVNSPAMLDVLATPGDPQKGTVQIQGAQEASEEFYRRFAAENYQSLYDSANSALKSSLSFDKMKDVFQKVNGSMGTCNTPTLAKEPKITTRIAARYVTLEYNRECANGDISERLEWNVGDERPSLISYYVTHSTIPIN